MKGKTAYVVADLEGSTGAWTRAHVQLGAAWQEARVELTRDINAVAEALLEKGVERVVVKDFHRTGYNLIPPGLDHRIHLVSGYYAGPAIGYGDLHQAHFALLVGLHASGGNGEGFLPHTLTGRISEIRVNGRRICEAELFATALSAFGVPVSFFSGCPAACREAVERMPWLTTFAIPKPAEIYRDGERRRDYIRQMRRGLKAKILTLDDPEGLPRFALEPPFDCQVLFPDEKAAERLNRWGFPREGNGLRFHSPSFDELYLNLLKIAYFPRPVYYLRSLALPLARMVWTVYSIAMRPKMSFPIP